MKQKTASKLKPYHNAVVVKSLATYYWRQWPFLL